MNEAVTNLTSEFFSYEVTEKDVEELRAEGVSEDEIPAVGTIRRWRRATHNSPRSEHKRIINLILKVEIIEFLQQRSSKPIENQIIDEIEKLMEAETKQKEKLRNELLNDTAFLDELREKLKAA